jgi:hypothetical protein
MSPHPTSWIPLADDHGPEVHNTRIDQSEQTILPKWVQWWSETMRSFLICTYKIVNAVLIIIIIIIIIIMRTYWHFSRSQWPSGLRRRSAAACLLGLRVQISPVTWMSVPCECCTMSGGVLCYGPITRPEEPYQMLCLSLMPDLEKGHLQL